jgi:hypothetical protein
MIKVYFSPTIYKSANKLIEHAKNNLSKSAFPPRNFCKTEMGIITLLKEGEDYPMHDDSNGKINKVTFLNNNGGMRFEELDVKAFTGLTMEFKTEEKHQPYTLKGDRWALLQRYEESKS